KGADLRGGRVPAHDDVEGRLRLALAQAAPRGDVCQQRFQIGVVGRWHRTLIPACGTGRKRRGPFPESREKTSIHIPTSTGPTSIITLYQRVIRPEWAV